MQVDRIQHGTQPKDDVGPALPARRAVVELAEHCAVRRFGRVTGTDSSGRQPIEYSELALAKPLVRDGARGAARQGTRLANELRRLASANVGRAEDDFGPLVLRQR